MIAQISDFFKRAVNQKDIRKKIYVTALLLAVFRLAAFIPAAGVDRTSLSTLFATSPLLSLLDVFSGGTLANFSIMALGLTPYINSSIIMQLLTFVIPSLEELSKEGEVGQEKINQYTRLITLPLAIFQSFGMYVLLQSQQIIPALSPIELIALVITMTAGTLLSIWIGELITEYGLGNGVSFLIFAGIIARLPSTLGRSALSFDQSQLFPTLVVSALTICIIGFIVYINEAIRKIPLQSARKTNSNVSGASYLPLRVNQAGVIPIIFAVSLVLMPSLLSQFLGALPNEKIANIAASLTQLLNPNGVFYNVLYFLLVVGFTYFYTSVVFNPEKIAENLQKSGSFIPGIRPGAQTEKYLNYVLNRITLAGGVFLGLIAIMPSLLQNFIGVSNLVVGGTGILIIVSVVLEVTRDIESKLVMKQYDKLLRI